jgi:hypothetical protein
MKDYASAFYELKQKFVELLLNLTEGDNPIVCRFILDNYPITALNNVLMNSLKQRKKVLYIQLSI